MKIIISLSFAIIFAGATSFNALAQLELNAFSTGFNTPIGIVNAGDERLFVIEQRGRVKIVNSNGIVNSEPFLDLSAKVSSSGNERGLLGLAFHPEYAQNGYFFINYTRASNGQTVVSRFSVSSNNPDMANPESEVELLTVTQPYSNHNGGQLLFGPDGYLYIALGDGGSGGDPDNYAQNRLSLLGKMLRIDVDVDAAQRYAIPPDNPFVNDNSTADEIWALGLRNPWRNSFDRLTGDFWIADVGQKGQEEINFQSGESAGGENYGWRCYEGSAPYNTNGCSGSGTYVEPVFTYNHEGSGCSGSVTGGYVYRGARYSNMFGHYFFADYCTGKFYKITKTDNGFSGSVIGSFDRFQYAAFGEDVYGELYVAFRSSGEIRKLADNGNCKPVAFIKNSGSPLNLEGGDSISLEAIYHPTLSYQWFLNGEELTGENMHKLLATNEGAYTVEVTNTNNACADTSAPFEITLTPSSVSQEWLNLVKLYFNPTTKTLQITGLPQNSDARIDVLALNGVVLKSVSTRNSELVTITTDGLPRGIYLVRVSTEKGLAIKKRAIY